MTLTVMKREVIALEKLRTRGFKIKERRRKKLE